jgi:hypothetical protein
VPLVTVSADYALDQLGSNKLLYASLHTAYSATGANEVSGGSYARQAATWSAASSGSKALTTTLPSFSVPGSTTVEYIGFWDASTAGNFQGMFPNGGGTVYTFTATTASSTFTASGSALSNTTTVTVFPTAGSTTPGGFTAGSLYYVVSASTDTFKLSATSGGSAITVTADGSGIVQLLTPETFGGAGTFAISSGAITLT